MSKDIRSYFSKSPKGPIKSKKPESKAKPIELSSDDEKKAGTSSNRAKFSKKSSKRQFLSDSDDEVPVAKKVTAKPDKKGKSTLPPAAARDFWGNEPVMRVVSPAVSKKLRKKEAEFHEDDDFEATLCQLDTSTLEMKHQEETHDVSSNGKRKYLDESDEDVKTKKLRRDASGDNKKDEINHGENGSRENKSNTTQKHYTDDKKSTNISVASNKLKFENLKGKKRATEIVFESNESKKKEKHANDNDVYEEHIEKKKQRAVLYNKYLQRGGARNPGSKPIPKGADNCLAGLSFLITGVLDSLEREEAEDLIQKYGGRIVKSVSRKTNFMVVGEDAGASKLEKAATFGTKQISEDELLNLIGTKSAGKSSAVIQARNTSKKRKKSESPEKPPRSPSPKKFSPPIQKTQSATTENKTSSQENGSNAESSSSVPESIPEITTDLKSISQSEEVRQIALVEKYRPRIMKQIIGQHGDKSNAKKLYTWLNNWHKNQSGNVKLTKPSPFAKSDDGAFFKACLLSGPPGVGKTTSAQVVCAELRFDLLEFNASDTRSKRLLKEEVSGILSNTTVKGYFTENNLTNGNGHAGSNKGSHNKLSSKHVLLMDEVDGMAGNEDRGGLQELISLIKSSEVPIICICNDRNNPKMRTLANYTFDLRFQKPRLEQIRGAMKSLCCKENINASTDDIDRLIQSTNYDIRQVINHLAMLGAGSTNQDNVKTRQTNKDLRLGPWDVIRKVFSATEHENMSIHDKSDLFFHDYNIAALFVQENYLTVIPKASGETLDRVARSAESLAIGDVIENAIRGNGAWSLLPTQACFSSVIPGTLMSGRQTAQTNFPAWLGRNSKRGKFDRLLQEITVHARLATGASKEAINIDYLNHLRDGILRPLALYNTDGIDDALNVMKHYHLLREDLESLVEVSLWPGQRDPFQAIDSKVRAAFTRAFNKSSILAPYLINAAPKKKSNQASQDEGFMEDYDDDATSDVDNDDMDTDRMIKAKKATVSNKTATTSKTAKKPAKRGRGKDK